MTEDQTQKYRDISATDRARYDRHKRLLKEGIKSDQVCKCDHVAEHAEKEMIED